MITRFTASLKMATRAYGGPTKQFDLSRDEACYAIIAGEEGDDWVGNWLTGMGFFDVRFPKATTRELTAEEQRWYDENNGRLRIGSLDEAMSQEDPIR